MRRAGIAAASAAMLAGCAGGEPPTAKRPGLINHVVFVKLVDPSDAEELIADSDRMLGTITSVKSYYCGRHIDTGRSTVIADYDVGAFMAFESEAGYASYVSNPAHVAFVEKWRPRLEWLRVYDIHDPSP